MAIWSFIVVVVVFISTYGLVSGQGSVNLQPLSNSTVCGNTAASFSCQTTVTGLLEWRDANGNTFSFTSSANNPGATGSLGNISLNLTEESGSTLTSTATIDRVTSDILLFCLNGPLSSSETINVADPPSALGSIRYSSSSGLLTWDPSGDTPNCCASYALEMVDGLGNTAKIPLVGPVFEYDISHIMVNTTFRVYCTDLLGRESASSDLLPVTFPPPSSTFSTCPTCPTCPTYPPNPPCPPVWVWIVIAILAVLLVIATIIAVVMTALYIYETCCKPKNDVSIKGSNLEMK